MFKVLWIVAAIGFVLVVLFTLRRLALRSARLHLALVIGIALAIFLAVPLSLCYIGAEIWHVFMGVQLPEHSYEAPKLSQYRSEIIKDLRLRCLLPGAIRPPCSVPDERMCAFIEDYAGGGFSYATCFYSALAGLLCGGVVYLLTRRPRSTEHTG